jgi:hypothetical protein
MTENDMRTLIIAALDLLNEFGREAAEILHEELNKEEHSEAEAWISAYYEPIARPNITH